MATKRREFSLAPIFWSITLLFSIVYYCLITRSNPKPPTCFDKLFPNLLATDSITYEWKNYYEFLADSSKFNGTPSVSRERTWDTYGPYGAIALDQPPTTKKWPQGVPDIHRIHNGAFLAIPGFSLQMNCLNIIRRSFYPSTPSSLFARPSRQQIDQCIEKFRQDLSCTFQTSLFPEINTNRTDDGTLPRVYTSHVCRNYEAILDWADENLMTENRVLNDFVPLDF